MIFKYTGLEDNGAKREGTIEAVSLDVAISSLQRRGLLVSSIKPEGEAGSIFDKDFKLFEKVTPRDIVILSRQMSTLFTAQVPALRIFRLLAAELDNKLLAAHLNDIAGLIQGGSSISNALAKYPDAFSDFYVNMVKAGEESGKLDQTFAYLAEYIDRSYAVTSKVKNALIYPAFVIFTFTVVMILMLTVVIPKISGIITDSGQAVPLYTQVVISLSNIFIHYGLLMAIVLAVLVFLFVRFVRTDTGKQSFDHFKLDIPYLGDLYKKLYLARIADNMNTMLSSGIPMVRVLEITSDVVDNYIYKAIVKKAVDDVRGGGSVSDSFAHYKEMPGIMVQMMRIGEETGNLGSILSTLAKFYDREVTNAVDTLVGLIEPIMIVVLGVGVGILLASVLIPIYNISASF